MAGPTIEELARRVAQLEGESAVRKLQHAYGYYCDKCLYDEVVDLFTDDCEVRFMHGVWRGRAGARRLYIERFRKTFTQDRNGPVWGFLLDHPTYQDIVTVAPDGLSARGRFRTNMQAGSHYMRGEAGLRQWWEGALYENHYVKDGGAWKIKVLNYNPVWHADFEAGWAYTRPEYVPFMTVNQLYPKDPYGPDEIDRTQVLWPDHGVLTFHFPHPVTGKKFRPQKPSMTPASAKKKPNPAVKDGKVMMPPRAIRRSSATASTAATAPAKPASKRVQSKGPAKTRARG